MKLLEVGFAGSPFFAEKILEFLIRKQINNFSLKLVLTQPERRKGRGRKSLNTPVYELAKKHNIKVYTPKSLTSPDDELISNLQNLDILVVVAYGLILPKQIIELPIYGCINLHPSLLPRWRGAAPIQRTIEAGDNNSGVCLIQMSEELDKGPIWETIKTNVDPHDNFDSLQVKLIDSSQILLENFFLNRPFLNNLKPTKQKIDGITYAQKILKKEKVIDWNEEAININNRIRAFDSFPGTYCYLMKKRVQFSGSFLLENSTRNNFPGKISGVKLISGDKSVLKISCGIGFVGIAKLKKDGGKWVTAKEFFNSIYPQNHEIQFTSG